MKTPEELADEHWEWLNGLLESMGNFRELRALQYVYKTSFIHGYKHGEESFKNE